MDLARHTSTRILLVRWCGAIALFGVFAIIATDIAGIVIVPGYNPLRESISTLAAGEYAWIQDIGLDACAVGLIALSIGLFSLRKSLPWQWVLAVALIFCTGIDLIWIATDKAYATCRGLIIHPELVYALFGIVIASLFLLVYEFCTIQERGCLMGNTRCARR